MEELGSIVFTVTNDITYDQRMARICGTLHGAGYKVHLVGRKRRLSGALPQKPYRQTRLSCFFQKGLLFYAEYNIRLFFYLIFSRADIFSAVDLDTIAACTLVAKIRSKKLVFDAHEYFTEVPEVTDRRMVKKIWTWIERLFVPHAHAAYTVSENLAAIFTAAHKKTFRVIRNAPKHKTAPITEVNNRLILYQGDLNEGRGLEQTIEAMQHLDAELHIAGDGPLMVKLKMLASQFQVSQKITFLGYVAPHELEEITAKARIGINLLQNKGLSYYYSLSNKFFNYMHSGVPQLCAPFPEYEHIVKNFRIALLCPCHIDEIVTSLKSLLEDDSLYHSLRRECERAAKEFNWEQEEKKLISIYQGVCK